jgi:hypothetical protein
MLADWAAEFCEAKPAADRLCRAVQPPVTSWVMTAAKMASFSEPVALTSSDA